MSAAKRHGEAKAKQKKTSAKLDASIQGAKAEKVAAEKLQDWTFVEKAFTAPGGRRHEPAFKFVTSKNVHRIALAGRQSGKTWAVFVAMIDIALKKEGTSIAGNTSPDGRSRQGTGVYEHAYDVSDPKIAGYIRVA